MYSISKREGKSFIDSIICIALMLTFSQLLFIPAILAVTSSNGVSSSNNGTIRYYLNDLYTQANSIQASASRLQKAIAILSTANNTASIVSMRNAQLKKLYLALDALNLEISIIGATCVNNDGPDCNIPICDSKCLNCAGPGNCLSCSDNFDGLDCSACKSGWKDVNCTVPICDSKCLNCSAPGKCVNCSGLWAGSDCNMCKIGWSGVNCSTPVCDSKCISCPSPGVCTSCSGNFEGATCSSCKQGWSGVNCSIPICDSKCTFCVSPGNCTAWTGSDCSVPICYSQTGALACGGSSKGTCTGPNSCSCKTGWAGSDCTTPICFSKTGSSACSGTSKGNCTAPDTCSCVSGWSGSECATPICSTNCNGRGTCTAPNTCSCNSGWSGSDCSVPVCTGNCNGRGTCTSPNTCSCITGWSGSDCSVAVCSGGCVSGVCSSPGVCTCNTGWTGSSCTTPLCTNSNGRCTTCGSPGVCSVCSSNYDGPTCSSCKSGWSGSSCSVSTTFTVKGAADNSYGIYLNGGYILAGSDWSTLQSTTRNLVSGDVLISRGYDSDGMGALVVEVYNDSLDYSTGVGNWRCANGDQGAAVSASTVNSWSSPTVQTYSNYPRSKATTKWIWTSTQKANNYITCGVVIP